MKKIIFILATLWSSAYSAKAQEGHIRWQRMLGGIQNENADEVKLNHSGGYILCGSSISGSSGTKTDTCRGSYDMWLVNVDRDGEVIWDKTYGTGMADQAFSVIPTNDGGFLLSGERSLNMVDWANPGFQGDADDTMRGFIDCWLLKLDIEGNIAWQKTFGGIWADQVQNVAEVPDGYILLCHSDSPISSEKADNCRDVDPCLGCPIGDLWLVKLDVSGNILWQKTIGGDRGEIPAELLITQSGRIIVGASSYSRISGEKTDSCRDGSILEGMLDYWILAVDGSDGDILWQKTIGGNRTDWLRSITETEDGDYLLAGWSTSDSTSEKKSRSRDSLYLVESNYLNGGDFWFVRMDTLGNILDQKSIGGDKEDILVKLVAIPGGYYAVGSSNSGISFDKTDHCRSEGSGMLFHYPDIWVLKLDNNLNITWQKTIGCEGDDIARDAFYDAADSTLIVLGTSASETCSDKSAENSGGYDFWLLKLSEQETTGIRDAKRLSAAISVYPNPSSGMLHISLPSGCRNGTVVIYDIMGRARYSGPVSTDKASIDIRNIPDGRYILRLQEGKSIYQTAFTILRG